MAWYMENREDTKETEMKKVALINDLSGFGKCSLVAAIPVISVMGIQACPLPTAILSSQTEFENYYCHDFTDYMDKFTEQWKQMETSFDGIYSGYLANDAQIAKVLYFLETFQKEGTFYLADPVMGDDGNKYDMFNEKFLEGMRQLTRRADVITPNLTEACLLAGENFEELVAHRKEEDYINRIVELGKKLLARAERPQTVMVTGIIREKKRQEFVGSLAVNEKETIYLETPYTGMSFSGTGDLFASVICGSLVKGLSVREAMEKASDFLQVAIEDASKQRIPLNHGVHFEKYLSRLL